MYKGIFIASCSLTLVLCALALLTPSPRSRKHVALDYSIKMTTVLTLMAGVGIVVEDHH